MDSLKNLKRCYELWVAANPDTVSDVEVTAKWVSYFLAGQVSDSGIVSELIYSLSNMLVFYNDRIIDRNNNDAISEYPKVSGLCYRLRVLVTTLEYAEVFIEISAKRLFGSKGKWIFVALIHVIKAMGRYFILQHSTEQIITSPAMPQLNRKTLLKQTKIGTAQPALTESKTHVRETSFTFQLKRSGRLVRKVEGAPPLQYRNFALQKEADEERKLAIPKSLLRAEYLYIVKPIVHLASIGLFGEKHWKQYMIALAMDLVSIRFYYKNRHMLTKQQRLEMSRRCVNLLLYLARSPFYERFTKERLNSVIGFAETVPMIKMIAKPLREYIPHWQNTYFYLWST